MHRRIPAEVVSRRDRQTKRPPTAKKEFSDEVVVDLKTATSLKPEARPRWLSKACKMVTEGKAAASELYDIISSRKFASGLPERVGQKLTEILSESLDLFSDKQRRYLKSNESPLMAHLQTVRELARDAVEASADLGKDAEDEEEDEAPPRRPASGTDGRRSDLAGIFERPGDGSEARARPVASSAGPDQGATSGQGGGSAWQVVQDDSARRRQVVDAEKLARKEAARKGERQRKMDAAEEETSKQRAAAEEAARRRKLEEDADNLFALAVVPQAPADTRSERRGGHSRSRSISSRTARRKAKESKASRRERDWQSSAPASGAGLSGSRALLMNRDYQEDLPHLPRQGSGRQARF